VIERAVRHLLTGGAVGMMVAEIIGMATYQSLGLNCFELMAGGVALGYLGTMIGMLASLWTLPRR
jgi:hypothetical protein